MIVIIILLNVKPNFGLFLMGLTYRMKEVGTFLRNYKISLKSSIMFCVSLKAEMPFKKEASRFLTEVLIVNLYSLVIYPL